MSNPNALPKYRPNVAAILRDAHGRILICERMSPSGAWQFPQGGVKRGESAEEALERELSEEIGLERRDYRIIERRGPYQYLFEKRRKGYCGQEQCYFLLELVGPATRVNVQTKEQEFRAARWIEPQDFDMNWLPEFKKEVYRRVLNDFFGLNR